MPEAIQAQRRTVSATEAKPRRGPGSTNRHHAPELCKTCIEGPEALPSPASREVARSQKDCGDPVEFGHHWCKDRPVRAPGPPTRLIPPK